jgi:acetyl esterase/lipase
VSAPRRPTTSAVTSWLLLLLAIAGAISTWNVHRPRYRPPWLALFSFFAGWITAELALHQIAAQLLIAGALIALGALAAWPGWVALPILAANCVLLWRCHAQAREAADAVEHGLQLGLGADYRSQISPEAAARFAAGIDWRSILIPLPRHPHVERVRNLTYREGADHRLRLDVYRHRDHPTRCPTLLQVHGGAWMMGSKNEQGLPLMLHLASQGWVCVSADYRLSPRATFPDPLVDLKHALRWIREEGPAYGVDPDFVVVTGGSAGGHLAALVALTANEPLYQPGFEHVDTSVRACVALYGVYDFTDRYGVWPHGGFAKLLRQRVMKEALEEAREAYEQASPMSRVGAYAPPFFVIHGDRDTMVPVEEARRFFALLREAIPGRVAYAEIPGAQHAFEIFPSVRAMFVVQGVERFLAWVYSHYEAERDKAQPPPGPVSALASADGLTAAARRL